jgi:hypothetical protein
MRTPITVSISGGGPALVALAACRHERASTLVPACATAPHLLRIPGATRFALAPGIAEVVGLPRACSFC